MSATFNPFGLRPSFLSGGRVSTTPQNATIASGYTSNIFQNSPIIIGTDGTIQLAVAATTNRILGTFQGCEFTLTATGRRVVSPLWPASTVATAIVAWITREPYITYEIQADGPVNQADLGNQASISTNLTGNGNTTTGFSTVSLVTASMVNTTSLQLRIVGFSPYVDNLPGDAFTIVQVQISQHQDVASQIAYGG